MTEVTIGRARLSAAPLFLHVTGLAKADEICSRIGLGNRGEFAKRHDVVNRKGFAHVLPAMAAVTILLGNNSRAHFKPSFAAIGGDPADIAGRLSSDEHARCLEAFAPTKSRQAILTGKPWLLAKGLTAMLARSFNATLPAWVFWPRDPRLKSVGRAQARSPLVTDLMIVRHGAIGHVPFAPALLTAKPSGRSAIGADGECTRAYFAGFFRHMSTITGTMGVAIAQKQADLFIDPPAPKPVQQSLLGDAA